MSSGEDETRKDIDESGSVTNWIGDLKSGGAAAPELLWNRYFDRLVRMTGTILKANRSTSADAEDIALLAFQAVYAGLAEGRFPKLNDRDDLWRILTVIATRKARSQIRDEHREKRGGGNVRRETDLAASELDSDRSLLDEVIADEPSPEVAASLAEESRRLLERLNDLALRDVVLLRLEGYTVEEIASKLHCSRRTVSRRLERIRREWSVPTS